MSEPRLETGAERFFYRAYGWPWTILLLSALVLLASASFLGELSRDTTPDANLEPDDPVVVFRERLIDTFGLSDPLILAVVHDGAHGVFNPHTLELVSWLSDRVGEIEGVDPDRVTSLATEKDIVGTEDALLVVPFLEAPPRTQAEADRVRAAVMDFELYLGSLVSRDGRATLVVAELLDDGSVEDVYERLRELVAEADLDGERVHIAGEGVASVYLGEYIDADAQKLNPATLLLICAILLLAYRTLRGLLLPLLAVIGAVLIAVGGMAAAGVPFYSITSALTVILIGISVADGIHILGDYYQQAAERAGASSREIAARAVAGIWRAVATTSVTSMAGFVALAATAYGPPMRAFGLFAALGILAALLISLFTIPAVLALLRPSTSGAFLSGPAADAVRVDRFGRLTAAIGRRVVARPAPVLVGAAALCAVGLAGTTQLRVNDSIISYFRPEEPIRLADEAINRALDGTTFFDIFIETDEPGALYEPENLRRIERLQARLEALPHVQGSVSVVDYVKQMNRALRADSEDAYAIPDHGDAVAQYFLLYHASGDPDDLDHVVDYDFRLANVRVSMNRGLHTDTLAVGTEIERYLEQEFNAPGIRGRLSGRAKVNYSWLETLWRNHFASMAVAFAAVWAAAALAFRSAVAGALAMVSVSLALLLTYAVMGLFGIWFRIGTSMLAPIAIGLSVDFSVHTIDRLIEVVRHQKRSLAEGFEGLFPSTGRALFFNFLAILAGFSVLGALATTEQLRNFGVLVCVCIVASFVASQFLVPALVAKLRPAFLEPPEAP